MPPTDGSFPYEPALPSAVNRMFARLGYAEPLHAPDPIVLTWMPGSSVYEIAMNTGLQEASEDTGGLILTGIAGSTCRFPVHAARMRDQRGIDLDLGLIRAGLIAMSLGPRSA
ncbi:hypothetical protein ACFVSX_28800 [Streptomyces rubiginosohelvolus]|uniref:hypothetical protein n=1 Tax=Streptomyces rubiginosohelvolus TaxID=67362 RepID=UPI0036D9AE1C